MSTSRWLDVKTVLEQLVDLPPARRTAVLDTACAGDPDLRSEVESFLAFSEIPDDPAALALTDASQVGKLFGPYRVRSELGRGGMGVVYLAERDDKLFEKQVAIKVLDTVFLPVELVKRFEAERRILARLEHPAIAHLLDAGLTHDGKPYFVLEFVAGVNLQTYLATHAPPPRQRLELFLKICDAVSHAHRLLIVHLDLKPGNIMVAGDGSPKLLDFGLARMLDAETGYGRDIASLQTRILTPSYASPEQISGGPVTVASDIYSLGFILQEVIAGQGGPRSISAGTKDDLDCIVAKALSPDPADRYRSVDQFADDVRHVLADEPVLARPAHWRYRAHLFVVRNRVKVFSASFALLGIFIALSAALYQARIAERRLNQVHQLANSLLFELNDAIQALPGATGARALVLRRAGQYLDVISKEAGNDNQLRRDLAQSYLRLGDVEGLYFEANLGQRQQARNSYQRALKIYEQIAASPHILPAAKLDLVEAHIRVSTSLESLHDYAGALDQLVQAEAIARSILVKIPPVYIALAKIQFGQAENYESLGKMPEALAARQNALSQIEKLASKRPDNAQLKRFLALAHKRYGATLLSSNNPAESINQIRQAIVLDAPAAANPNNAVAQADLALDETYLGAALKRNGDAAGALLEYRKAVELQRNLVAADPKNTRSLYLLTSSEEKLGTLLREGGNLPEAFEYLQTALHHVDQIQPPNDEGTFKAAQIQVSLARAFLAANQRSQAQTQLNSALTRLNALRSKEDHSEEVLKLWEQASQLRSSLAF